MSCQGCGCSCGGTIKSRRCQCAASVVDQSRDRTLCENNKLFDPSLYVSDAPDFTDAYGSGLSSSSIMQMRNFDHNIALQQQARNTYYGQYYQQ